MSAVSTMGVLKTKELGFASTLKAFGTASDANPLSMTFANQAAARTLNVPALSGNAEMLTDLSTLSAAKLNINGASAEPSLADADEFLFYDATASANRKVTGANLKTYVGGGGSGVPSGTNGQVIVYDATNAAAAVALSGDATIVANGAMTIANDAVTEAKLATNAVSEQKIASGAVSEQKLAANCVTSAKIQSGAVGSAALAAGAVNSAAMGAGAVDSSALASGAVNAAALGAGAVEEAKLAANAVTEQKLANGAVTSDKLAANAVVAAKIQDDAVTDAKIASFPTSAGTMEASKLLVCDANKDLTGGRNITLTGTSQAAEMAIGSSQWKFLISGGNLLLQYWSGAAWVTKQQFEPS